MAQLQALFNPQSIAIIGASSDPASLGTVLYDNLRAGGFEKPIFFVNPKYDNLWDHPCYKSILDVPEPVDMVLIAIPAKFIPDVLNQSGEKGIKSAIIISAGFSETGEEGKKLEEELIQIAASHEIRLLGPNCLGLIVPGSKMNASFAASTTADGNIAFLSQSGAFCTAMIDWALDTNVGFSHFVSLGNKADVDEVDLILDWKDDDSVQVIAAYLEEIEDGRDFVSAIEQTSKPVVVLKPGESEEAKQAMTSHTGSLATSSLVTRTALSQANAIQVSTMQEMFNLMMSLSWSLLPQGNRIAVVTNAGGPGIIATDALKAEGLELAEFSPKTQNYLNQNLPPTANTHNPVDVIGDALAERFKLPLDALAQDENVDGIIVIVTPQLVTQIEETAKLIITEAKHLAKPIFTAFVGGKYSLTGKLRLFENKIPAFDYVESAIKTMAHMYRYKKGLENKVVDAPSFKRNKNTDTHAVLEKYAEGDAQALTSVDAGRLLDEFEVDVPQQAVIHSADEAVHFANNVGYPIVIKSASDKILHKTDLKALYLNITNEDQLRETFTQLTSNMRHVIGDNQPLPVLIQEQVSEGVEVILGANRDGASNVYDQEDGIPGFGHVLLFGTGGIYTEVYSDTSSRLVPAHSDELRSMLAETEIYQILEGARGQEPKAVQRVVETLEKLQAMVMTYPLIEQIDINPAFVTKTRCVVVDFKVIVKK